MTLRFTAAERSAGNLKKQAAEGGGGEVTAAALQLRGHVTPPVLLHLPFVFSTSGATVIVHLY